MSPISGTHLRLPCFGFSLTNTIFERAKTFNRRGYRYQAKLSNDHNFVFTRDKGETYETKNRKYRGGRR